MNKIKVVSVAIHPNGCLLIVDTNGRLWMEVGENKYIQFTELPDDPGQSEFRVRAAANKNITS